MTLGREWVLAQRFVAKVNLLIQRLTFSYAVDILGTYPIYQPHLAHFALYRDGPKYG